MEKVGSLSFSLDPNITLPSDQITDYLFFAELGGFFPAMGDFFEDVREGKVRAVKRFVTH